VIQCESVT